MKHFLRTITRNPLSLAGCAVTTSAAVLILSLFGIETIGFRGGPYLGIVTFVILPALFVLGLVLIPAGIFLERRRRARGGAVSDAFPVIDLNVDRTRSKFLTFIGLTIVNIVILALATYKGVEVMDSTEFCGTTCHSVMSPEYTTYSRSPHSNVACVSCHIGPGADWFVKSKLSGSWQLVSVSLDLYPRPIPTPVENLRPARETCEQCHWPSKFVGDRLKVITRFQQDETNTETKTVLLMRVGGRTGMASKGIHWHVDPGVQIRYLADRTRNEISRVELTRADGTQEVFSLPAPEGDADGSAIGEPEEAPEWRTMDCVDCHNRPTHIYRAPEDEIDQAIFDGRIDRSLPFVRREGFQAILKPYDSHDAARAGIAADLQAFYGQTYPDVAASRASEVEAAAKALGDIYCTNVFPSMNIVWGSYPNHLGHEKFPGCFRCHDDMHRSASGATIRQDCDLCHSALAIEESNPEILKQLNP